MKFKLRHQCCCFQLPVSSLRIFWTTQLGVILCYLYSACPNLHFSPTSLTVNLSAQVSLFSCPLLSVPSPESRSVTSSSSRYLKHVHDPVASLALVGCYVAFTPALLPCHLHPVARMIFKNHKTLYFHFLFKSCQWILAPLLSQPPKFLFRNRKGRIALQTETDIATYLKWFRHARSLVGLKL